MERLAAVRLSPLCPSPLACHFRGEGENIKAVHPRMKSGFRVGWCAVAWGACMVRGLMLYTLNTPPENFRFKALGPSAWITSRPKCDGANVGALSPPPRRFCAAPTGGASCRRSPLASLPVAFGLSFSRRGGKHKSRPPSNEVGVPCRLARFILPGCVDLRSSTPVDCAEIMSALPSVSPKAAEFGAPSGGVSRGEKSIFR